MQLIVAYLDAGTGSLLLQALLGGLAGLGVALRAFRMRLLTRRPSEPDEGSEHTS